MVSKRSGKVVRLKASSHGGKHPYYSLFDASGRSTCRSVGRVVNDAWAKEFASDAMVERLARRVVDRAFARLIASERVVSLGPFDVCSGARYSLAIPET